MIILPRFVSLDTSTVSNLASDYYSGESSKRDNAKMFRDGLIEAGWYLTVSSDHLIELAQHANVGVVVSRFKFLRTFKNLAWIRNVEGTGIGSFLDIDCFEIRAVVDQKLRSKKLIANQVRKHLLVASTGDDLFRDRDVDLWIKLANQAKPGLLKSQSTASILRTEPVEGVREMKLREFLSADYRDVKDIPRMAREFAAGMATQIEKHGDKRVKGADDLAKDFYKQTLGHIGDIQAGQALRDGDSAFIESLAVAFAIPASVINLDMTVGQLGDWAHFSMMLQKYSRKLGRAITLEHVKPHELLGWSLRLNLRDYQNQAKRVSGSDFGDRNLAYMLPYLDSCEVDKRTLDYLRRFASHNNPEFDYLNHRFKCNDYRTLLATLAAST